jgi:hypothetical protein
MKERDARLAVRGLPPLMVRQGDKCKVSTSAAQTPIMAPFGRLTAFIFYEIPGIYVSHLLSIRFQIGSCREILDPLFSITFQLRSLHF